MKTSKLFIFIFILMVGISGCFVQINKNGSTENPYYVIAISQANLMEPWRIQMNQEIMEEAAQYENLRLVFRDAGNDTKKQEQDLTDLMGYAPDLLIVSMNDSDRLTPVVAQIYEEIPVIVLDRDVEGYDYTLFIGLDNYALGMEAGDYIQSQYPGSNVVEILGSIASKPAKERQVGFEEALNSESMVAISGTIYGDWQKDLAHDQFLQYLKDGREVDLVYAHSDDMAYGAYAASRQMGKELTIIGVDGLTGPGRGLDLVSDGILDSTFICPTGGRAAIKYALDILENVAGLPKKIILRTHHVTQENVNYYMENQIQYIPYNEEEARQLGEITIGYAQIGAESNWRKANSQSIIDAAKDYDITLLFENVDNNYSDEMKQKEQIERLYEYIDIGVDVIAMTPIVESGWEEVLNAAREAEIPVILSDRRVNLSTEYYTTYIGSDFVEEGRRAARWLLDHIKTPGSEQTSWNVVELFGTLESAPAKGRSEGFHEIIKEESSIHLLDSLTGNFEYQGGKKAMETLLDTYGSEIDVVFAHNDDMAVGAIEAIEAYGMSAGTDIIIISVDGTGEALKLISVGKLNCSVECNPLLGPQMMKAVKELMMGNELPLEIITEEGVFTAENAKENIRSRQY